ncbi:hypothetical protein [Lacrimispora sp. 38-1]|uniref:hypothetical protein n=1 Tax=Lacrimispora sp. 38-1 TaxID=3125778 RepID=UPI003CE7B61D
MQHFIGTFLGLAFTVTVINIWINCLKKQKEKVESESKVVRIPLPYRYLGIFTLAVGVPMTIFFFVGHALLHIKIIGMPINLLGLFIIYITYHWKILVNFDSIIVVHNFRYKRKNPFSSIEKVILRNIIITNVEMGESMEIFVSGKKITNLDECYEGYKYLKEVLIKNYVKIEQK